MSVAFWFLMILISHVVILWAKLLCFVQGESEPSKFLCVFSFKLKHDVLAKSQGPQCCPQFGMSWGQVKEVPDRNPHENWHPTADGEFISCLTANKESSSTTANSSAKSFYLAASWTTMEEQETLKKQKHMLSGKVSADSLSVDHFCFCCICLVLV